MKIRRRSIMASTDKDYASLRGMDFKKARDILTKDGFHEHEYGDKDDNNGYAVYRKGDKEVELQYRWNQGKRKGEAHAGKVTNVYVDDNINSSCTKRSVKASYDDAEIITDEFLTKVNDPYLENQYQKNDFEVYLIDGDTLEFRYCKTRKAKELATKLAKKFYPEYDVLDLTKLGAAKNSYTKKTVEASRSKAPRRRMNVMAGPGAGYTIEWELDSIRNVNSFDVVDVSKPDEWGTVTVTADCDVDIDVTIKGAWSYMYGFNHPIEGVSAKIHRVVFDYNISDNYGDLLNFEDYENLTEDSEYIDEVMNAVYQINEMEAMNILENDAWETIKGDEFSYGGGWSHSTWDGTILEVDKYNFADIQVTDQMVVDYVDRAVTNENLVIEYQLYEGRANLDMYYDTEEEAREAAIDLFQSGEITDEITITRVEWTEILLNTEGETDLDDSYSEDIETLYYDDYAPEAIGEE